MIQKILTFPSKLFLGKGIDKKFPVLVNLHKKIFFVLAKEGRVKVNMPLGLKLYVSTKDIGLGMFLRTKGEYEPLQTKLFLESIKPGFTVFDIGANIGYYSMLASKAVGKNGKVYAFEPDPRNLKFLKSNIILNKCQNVKVITKALGKEEKLDDFTLDLANPGESTLGKGRGKKIKVKTITLNNFIKKNRIRKINIIKMDIEGGELEALEGGKEVLKKLNNIKLFLECNENALEKFAQTPENLVSLIKMIGFKIENIINEFNRKNYEFSKKRFSQILKQSSFMTLIAQKYEKN